jgi:hypothetical protein
MDECTHKYLKSVQSLPGRAYRERCAPSEARTMGDTYLNSGRGSVVVIFFSPRLTKEMLALLCTPASVSVQSLLTLIPASKRTRRTATSACRSTMLAGLQPSMVVAYLGAFAPIIPTARLSSATVGHNGRPVVFGLVCRLNISILSSGLHSGTKLMIALFREQASR